MKAEELVGANRQERLRAEVDAKGLEKIMNADFETVSPSDTVNVVLKRMRELDMHEMPVAVDGGKLMGVVSYGTLLKRRNVSIETKAETLLLRPQNVTVLSPVTEVAEIMINSGFRELPVTRDGTIIGVVSRSGLLRIIQEVKELQRIPVSEVMSKEVRTVRLDTSVKDAVRYMSAMEVRVLPVVDDRDRIIGVVGIKDISHANWHLRDRATVGELAGESIPIEVKVGSVAVEPAVVAGPDMTLGEAAKIMLDRGISTLPVVDFGKLLGIVTKYDLIALLASLRQRSKLYIQISGLSDDDRFSQEMMVAEIEGSMKKIAAIETPVMFDLHVAAYKDEGLNYKYSLHGRLTTDDRLYTASSTEWDLVQATSTLMKTFERRVIDHKEQKLDHRRRTKNIGHHQ